MNTREEKELLAKYNDAFIIIMDATTYSRTERRDAAIRAATLAEVLKDQERLINALTVVQALRN